MRRRGNNLAQPAASYKIKATPRSQTSLPYPNTSPNPLNHPRSNQNQRIVSRLWSPLIHSYREDSKFNCTRKQKPMYVPLCQLPKQKSVYFRSLVRRATQNPIFFFLIFLIFAESNRSKIFPGKFSISGAKLNRAFIFFWH